MKLSELKRDVSIIEKPQWQDKLPDAGELRLFVRGMRNTAYRRLEQKLVDGVPRALKVHGIDPIESERIVGRCLAETVLDGWDGLSDDNGEPVPYTREKAIELLTDPNFDALRSLVVVAASRVNEQGMPSG